LSSLITFLEETERKISDRDLEKLKNFFHSWLNGIPFNSRFDELEPFIFMREKIKSKLKRALKTLEINGWSGFYAIIGNSGSGKTQFALWLLNNVDKNEVYTSIIDLAKINPNEVILEIKRIIRKNKEKIIGVFIDNIDSFLVEQDYLRKAHQLITNLLTIEKQIIDISRHIFFIITINQSTWIRFSNLEISGKKLSDIFQILSRISFSLHELKSVKSDITKKIAAVYYLSRESKAVKEKIRNNAKIVLSFLKKFYLSQLKSEIRLRDLVINMSSVLKTFIEHLDESMIYAQKGINTACKTILESYLTNILKDIDYGRVNEIFNISIFTNLKKAEFMERSDIIFLEIKAISSFYKEIIYIPIFLSTEILRKADIIAEVRRNYGNVIVFLPYIRDISESLFDLIKTPEVFCIKLAPWFKYACYLSPEGAFILLDSFTRINVDLRRAILYFVLRVSSKIIPHDKENLESIILIKITSILLKAYSSFYNYSDFEKLIVTEITDLLSNIGLSLSKEYISRLIDVIRNILETRNIIELVNNQYIFQIDKLSTETIFELAKTISRELAFRIKFLL